MFRNYLSNYLAGLKLVTGLSVKRDDFHVSLPFISIALLSSIAVFALFDYFNQNGVIYQNVYGSAILGSFFFCGALVVIVISHLQEDYYKLPLLITTVLCALFWFAILVSLSPFDWALQNQSLLVPLALLAVGLFIAGRCILTVYDYPKRRTFLVAGPMICFVAIISWQQLYFPTLFSSYIPDEDNHIEPTDIEQVFYQQNILMNKKLATVGLHTPGERDFYFIGFGSSDRQTVFESETKFVANIVNEHFATTGKSLILFNNSESLEQEPFANRFNLKTALHQVGKKMDVDEDVLILLLTSHGSEQAELSVDLHEFPLESVSADNLRSYLDQSAIKWRIIIVSACYSGSFIEQLADENSLIITAAAADRNSFGCSSERELTVFGEAYFKNAFAKHGDFIKSFEEARLLIEQWENEYELEFSDPQIKLGANIQQLLKLATPDIHPVGSRPEKSQQISQ